MTKKNSKSPCSIPSLLFSSLLPLSYTLLCDSLLYPLLWERLGEEGNYWDPATWTKEMFWGPPIRKAAILIMLPEEVIYSVLYVKPLEYTESWSIKVLSRGNSAWGWTNGFNHWSLLRDDDEVVMGVSLSWSPRGRARTVSSWSLWGCRIMPLIFNVRYVTSSFLVL